MKYSVLVLVLLLLCLSVAHSQEICEAQCSARLQASPSHVSAVPAGHVIGGRPSECRISDGRGRLIKYCGCALSVRLFGRVIPELNLAWNWVVRFPRASAAPGLIAARRGHVMQLERHVAGLIWVVYDPNSGGGFTRRHPRSIAGFTVVDPQRSRVAALPRNSGPDRTVGTYPSR